MGLYGYGHTFELYNAARSSFDSAHHAHHGQGWWSAQPNGMESNRSALIEAKDVIIHLYVFPVPPHAFRAVWAV